jgi:DNA (cytosine-5)-methyltransferase 1
MRTTTGDGQTRKKTRAISRETCAVIDLFCGAGGLSHGFVQEGFKIAAGADVDAACKFPFEENNDSRFLQRDVTKLPPSILRKEFRGAATRILIGCAPCQPFSTYAQGRPENEKWHLLRHFARLVTALRPEVISMENVPELKRFSVYEDFVAELRKADYDIDDQLVFCPDYGIPQTRTRLVFLASRLGPIKLLPATHSKENYPTVAKAIGDMPEIKAGEAHPSDRLHQARALNATNLRRIQASKPGGTWRDWPEKLLLKCHLEETGDGYGAVYGRMEWDQPAPTMTTHCTGYGNGRFGHPKQDRAISLREAALIQSFPRNYKFFESGAAPNMRDISRLIGNAVPVRLGRIVAKSIRMHLITVGRLG